MDVTYFFLSLLFIFCVVHEILTQESVNVTTPASTAPASTTSASTTRASTTPPSTTKHTIGETIQYAYNATEEAMEIHEAITGPAKDTDTIIRIISKRDYEGRKLISEAYQKLYTKSLRDDFANVTSGNFRDLLMALLEEPNYFLAKEVHNALTSAKIDYAAINQIIAIGSKFDLPPVLRQYSYYFEKPLIAAMREVLKGEILEFFELFLKEPLKGRDEVFKERLIMQVKYLPDPDGKCLNSSKLLWIFAREPDEHLRHLCFKYEMRFKNTSTTVEMGLEKAFTDPILSTYLTIVKFIKSPPDFYVRLFHEALTGVGTDDKTLIRLVVGPRPINMVEIRTVYHVYHKKALRKVVMEETSGDYQRLLLAVIGDQRLFQEGGPE